MDNMEYRVRECCAICKNKELYNIISFGDVPLAGDFPSKQELQNDRKYELSLQFCPNCYLVQTDSVVNANRLFRDYRYMSSIGLAGHFTEVASLLKKRFNLDSHSSVVEIGSNDGVLQKPFMDLGVRCVGFEPSVNISKVARDKGCEVINDFFNQGNVLKYIDFQSVDLVVSNNCFAHIDDIHSIVQGVKSILREKAFFVIEVHYVRKLIDQMQYDNIYHEHIYYYSLQALRKLFEQYGMTIVDFDEIPVHSGSIRVFVKNAAEPIPSKVAEKLEEEKEAGLTEQKYYAEFANRVREHVANIKAKLIELRSNGSMIVGYGASGRANMLCNLCGLSTDLINYIVDESPERCDRYIAGVHIPIVSRDFLLKDDPRPKYIFIFAWNYAKMIMDKLGEYSFVFILPFPEMRIVSRYSELKDFVSI